MNVFFLSKNPSECARFHTNKHVISQLKESCQLLSTAHRVLDGAEYSDASSGRNIKRWKLNNPTLDSLLYKSTHLNHPSAVWARQTSENYMWLCELLKELCKEYTYRYGKTHKCEQIGLVDMLYTNIPKNIHRKAFTEPTPAMPDECIVKGNSIASYRKYYNIKKQHLASWKGKVNSRTIPDWYEEIV